MPGQAQQTNQGKFGRQIDDSRSTAGDRHGNLTHAHGSCMRSRWMKAIEMCDGCHTMMRRQWLPMVLHVTWTKSEPVKCGKSGCCSDTTSPIAHSTQQHAWIPDRRPNSIAESAQEQRGFESADQQSTNEMREHQANIVNIRDTNPKSQK
mgnify:CR=1 FL=1